MKNVIINISHIIGGGFCVAADDGQKVYAAISRIVEAGDRAVLSFEGVTRMTTAFLNSAVGQLYGEFPEATIQMQLAPPINFEPWHLSRLRAVIVRAKEYFKNIEKAELIIKGALDEGGNDEDS